MAVFSFESNNLRFNRRAVTGANTDNSARVHRRAIQVCQNNLMNAGIGSGDPAGNLFGMSHGLIPGEIRNLIPHSVLTLALREIDRLSIDTGRRTGLQTPHRHADFNQFLSETDGRRIAHASCLIVLQTDMDKTVEESPRGENNRSAEESDTRFRYHTFDGICLQDQIIRGLLENIQIFLIFQFAAHRDLIKIAINLGAC